MAFRLVGNKFVDANDPQFQMYNTLGRDAGTMAVNNNSGNDNFFTKRWNSIDNAIGTTGASIVSAIDTARENQNIDNRMKNYQDSMNNIYKKYGYDDSDAYYNAKNSTQGEIFNKYGFNDDDFWNKRAEADLAGNKDRVAELEKERRDVISRMNAEDADKVNYFENIQNELINQSSANLKDATKAAKDWENYRTNSDVGKRINQDRGKFAGSAINTLSTAFDVLAPGAGVLANSVQGGVEGVADELEQNGLENFDWGRAGQNALTGAATGAVVGAVNKGLSNSLAKKGGNLFEGGNRFTSSINRFNQNTGLGRLASTVGTGAARGAISGAVGGATGAGISSALNGVELGQGIANTIQGAKQGAEQGAFAGSVMAGAGLVGDKVNDTINDLRAKPDNGFGRRYNQFAGKGDKAIDYLLKRGSGEVESAVKSPAVEAITGDGNIDLVYGKTGDDGYGLAHIAEKHGVDVAKKIPSILENGSVVDDPRYTNNNRITLVGDDNTGAVRLGWDGNKKQWVVTAYEGLPYSSASSANSQIANSAALRGSSVQGQNDAPVSSNIPQNRQDVNTAETEVYRTLAGETEQPFLAYGESELGNRTRRGMLADSLERFGNTLEGAQTNVTRAAAKDLGIESTGKVIENVRKKTGITNLETQAKLARELTGGENSLMDNIQRQALTASEDGIGYRVNTDPVLKEIDSIVDKYADTNMFGSQNARNKFISNLKQDITNFDSDVLTIANRMKANAADLRGRGITSPTPADSAKAKIYSEVANRLDDLSYKAIPQDNVEAMFDATISEMRGRANQAAQNGNRDVAKAYNQLADSLNAEPRTIKAYRSFKKDFVDAAKISDLTNLAENGAAVQMGRGFGGGIKKFVGTVAQRPVNAALAKLGGGVNSLADRVAGESTPSTTPTPTTTNTTAGNYNPATQIYNAIGRTEGATNAEQARTANYIADAVQNANTLEDLVYPTNAASTNAYNSVYGNPSSTDNSYWTTTLKEAIWRANAAGDAKSASELYSMYQDELAKQAKNTTSQTKLTDKQRQANAAARALDDFEGAESNFAYDVSDIPILGNIANLGGNEYRSKAEALALQVGYMLSGATVNKEEAKNIGMAYVPQPRDSEAVRRSKLNQLRGIISDYQSTYGE